MVSQLVTIVHAGNRTFATYRVGKVGLPRCPADCTSTGFRVRRACRCQADCTFIGFRVRKGGLPPRVHLYTHQFQSQEGGLAPARPIAIHEFQSEEGWLAPASPLVHSSVSESGRRACPCQADCPFMSFRVRKGGLPPLSLGTRVCKPVTFVREYARLHLILQP